MLAFRSFILLASAASLCSIGVMAAAVETTACAVREVPFVLFGVGGVGSELLRIISRHRNFHAEKCVAST
jgi:hypothetical protein